MNDLQEQQAMLSKLIHESDFTRKEINRQITEICELHFIRGQKAGANILGNALIQNESS